MVRSFTRTTLVIYQNIIPISLYISVQIVKTAAVSPSLSSAMHGNLI